MKVPVPVTVAVHWLVWPDCTEVGVHEIDTAVTVELLEPPPQAAIPKSAEQSQDQSENTQTFPQETIRAHHPSYCK